MSDTQHTLQHRGTVWDRSRDSSTGDSDKARAAPQQHRHSLTAFQRTDPSTQQPPPEQKSPTGLMSSSSDRQEFKLKPNLTCFTKHSTEGKQPLGCRSSQSSSSIPLLLLLSSREPLGHQTVREHTTPCCVLSPETAGTERNITSGGRTPAATSVSCPSLPHAEPPGTRLKLLPGAAGTLLHSRR